MVHLNHQAPAGRIRVAAFTLLLFLHLNSTVSAALNTPTLFNSEASPSSEPSTDHSGLSQSAFGFTAPTLTYDDPPEAVSSSRHGHWRFASTSSVSPPTNSSLPFPSPPYSAPPSPPANIVIHNERDLAQQITAATGPSTTTLILPPILVLSQALPPVLGPLQLVSASGANVTCLTTNFTALSVNTSSFGMTGLSWVGCGTVLVFNSLPTGTDSNIIISGCSFVGNRVDPSAVSNVYIRVHDISHPIGSEMVDLHT